MDKRYNRGEEHGRSKIRARDVLAIRSNTVASDSLLAIRHGLTRMQVWRIRNNKTWKHLKV